MPDLIDALADQLGLDGAEAQELRAYVERLRESEVSLETISLEDLDGSPLAMLSDVATPVRYPPLERLGQGGMGDVYRVRDETLERTVAMKRQREKFIGDAASKGQMIREAKVTARLQHPGIVAVHELGELSDGRVYFTMSEVKGQVLSRYIGRWNLHRLIDVLHRACETLAYVHSEGFLHRDLKPDNLMVGSFGEVVVVDWGIAATVEEAAASPVLAGTPAFIAPEIVRGGAATRTSDVYALGGILFQVLFGRPPYTGDRSREILDKVIAGPPDGLAEPGPSESGFGFEESRVPEALREICARAMSRNPADRHADAGELAEDLAAWLDGSRRREEAETIVTKALTLLSEAWDCRSRANALRTEAEDMLRAIPTYADESEKGPAWRRQDQADALEADADRLELDVDRGLHAALRIDSSCQSAHLALAERALQAHRKAEEAGQVLACRRAEVLLREHALSLHPRSRRRAELLEALVGDGWVSLVTDPPGAEVHVSRYLRSERRWVPRPWKVLGITPIERVSLPMGSYLFELRHPDHPPVRYPVAIRRQQHWDGVDPRTGKAAPVRLGADLPEGVCRVAGGWFQSGGDPDAFASLPRRDLWVDDFAISRFPVTNREYIRFLDALVAADREEEALRYAPNERAGVHGEAGAQNYGRRPDGGFVLIADSEGDIWDPDWPVFNVDWFAAHAYARWLADETGLPWRLPNELEWEKAARGVDGRLYPFGNQIDPSWACMQGSHARRPLPVRVQTYPTDESPYGVRGMAGGMRDWCVDVATEDGPRVEEGTVLPVEPSDDAEAFRVIRGGGWYLSARNARAANRYKVEPYSRDSFHGFRLVYSLDG